MLVTVPDFVPHGALSCPFPFEVLSYVRFSCSGVVYAMHRRYAYISQRGFYPDDREKANQDAYGVATQYDGDSNKVRSVLMLRSSFNAVETTLASFCEAHRRQIEIVRCSGMEQERYMCMMRATLVWSIERFGPTMVV